MRVFFTSDTHFFHRAIIQYCQRPFDSLAQMNTAIMRIWNRQVRKTDRVYHLGDVSFGGASETFQLLAQLNGEICLITGNHDDKLSSDPYLCERFSFVQPYHEETISGQKIIMCHYPITQWNYAQRGSWHLYGHTHGSIQLAGRAMDVGIDAHPQFRLWSFEEIAQRLQARRNLSYPPKPHYPQREFDENWQILRVDGQAPAEEP